jgi:hypothetical protein
VTSPTLATWSLNCANWNYHNLSNGTYIGCSTTQLYFNDGSFGSSEFCINGAAQDLSTTAQDLCLSAFNANATISGITSNYLLLTVSTMPTKLGETFYYYTSLPPKVAIGSYQILSNQYASSLPCPGYPCVIANQTGGYVEAVSSLPSTLDYFYFASSGNPGGGPGGPGGGSSNSTNPFSQIFASPSSAFTIALLGLGGTFGAVFIFAYIRRGGNELEQIPHELGQIRVQAKDFVIGTPAERREAKIEQHRRQVMQQVDQLESQRQEVERTKDVLSQNISEQNKQFKTLSQQEKSIRTKERKLRES